ncbi:hypothetical protein Pcar_3424 [Syntrophotalea carbinolica DSM 2380]|uniref:Uncharacterized protein n=1 Tax=Syntrophotalea carbinolica (strain DSM 2380 / NBRC 103641 / GraBd1) TaxID=338963 RepID=J9TJK5_SYNC1|nr:hypothetical protein Pcar_3424 [Syntrophotalea carbinolica DSM 2380]
MDTAILAKEVGKPPQVFGEVSCLVSEDDDCSTGHSVPIHAGTVCSGIANEGCFLRCIPHFQSF